MSLVVALFNMLLTFHPVHGCDRVKAAVAAAGIIRTLQPCVSYMIQIFSCWILGSPAPKPTQWQSETSFQFSAGLLLLFGDLNQNRIDSLSKYQCQFKKKEKRTSLCKELELHVRVTVLTSDGALTRFSHLSSLLKWVKLFLLTNNLLQTDQLLLLLNIWIKEP